MNDRMNIFNGNSTGIHSVFEMTFLCRVGGIRTTSPQPSRSIVAVVAATLVACLPNYVMYRPVPYVTSATAHRSVAANASCPVSAPNNSNHTRNVTWPRNAPSDPASVGSDDGIGYWFDSNEFVTDTTRTINFWVFGVAMKVVPCVLLTVLSALLVRATQTSHTEEHCAYRLLTSGF